MAGNLTDFDKFLKRIVKGKKDFWYIYLNSICHDGWYYPERIFRGKNLEKTINKAQDYIIRILWRVN